MTKTQGKWIVLLVLAGCLAIAGPAFGAAGCCEKGNGGGCFQTDSASFCEDVCGGGHYQLAFCSGGTCHPTASGDSSVDADPWPFPIPLCPWARSSDNVTQPLTSAEAPEAGATVVESITEPVVETATEDEEADR